MRRKCSPRILTHSDAWLAARELTGSCCKLRQLEAETAGVREESERLQRMQELKSREEELKRTIEKKIIAPRP
jgi:hypothetical protein